jgi:hypothetical protein
MRSFIFFVSLAACCWVASVSYAAPSVAPGFLEGRLTVHLSGGAKLADETEAKAASVNYAEYPLVILRKDDRKEVERITPDENGYYRVPLPPGDYLLELKTRVLKRIQAQLHPFTIVSQQTVEVNLELLPNHAVSGAPR